MPAWVSQALLVPEYGTCASVAVERCRKGTRASVTGGAFFEVRGYGGLFEVVVRARKPPAQLDTINRGTETYLGQVLGQLQEQM